MQFVELKNKSGMTLTQLSNYFGVPYRTIQNWVANVSKCPTYLMNLFVYKMEQEGILYPSRPVCMYTEEEAIRIKITLTAENTYSSFLALYRQVIKRDDLYKIYNDEAGDVYLICAPHAQDSIVCLAEQFGSIIEICRIKLVKHYIRCYPKSTDVEFVACTTPVN